MRQKEVLERVPVTKNDLEFWERRGFLKPKKIKWGTRKIRDYSEEDIELLEQMSVFREQGLTPKRAYERVQTELKQRSKTVRITDLIGDAGELREKTAAEGGISDRKLYSSRGFKHIVTFDHSYLTPQESEFKLEAKVSKLLIFVNTKAITSLIHRFTEETIRFLSRQKLDIDAVVSTNSRDHILLGAFCAIYYERLKRQLDILSVQRMSDDNWILDGRKPTPASRILVVETIATGKDKYLNLMDFLGGLGCRVIVAASIFNPLSDQSIEEISKRRCFVSSTFGQRDVAQLIFRGEIRN